MPSKYPARSGGRRASECRQCGALAADGAVISARDLCADCGLANAEEAAREMSAQTGPRYEAWQREWRRGMRSFINSL